MPGMRPIALLVVSLVSTTVTTAAPSPPRVAEGFVIEMVAGPEQVRFPMFAAFDDRGRLFVAESSGLDLYKEISELTRKCRVSVLEDRDGDGQFETSSVFQDQLVMPMGALWRDGKLYVPDGPDLISLQDTDGDGRADKRTVVLSGFGHLDNGGLHGLTFGPEGWLYMTCGQPDGYKIKRPDGTFLESKSGSLLRCRPDGSDLQVIARGFENLVEVAFHGTGDVIGTVNWYQKPEGGIRDALVHVVPGGLYPYVPDVGTPLPVTGSLLPAVTKFPAVALSGFYVQQGAGLGREHVGHFFSAQHNTRTVGRHVLTRVGSTFGSEDSHFVTSDDPDFHPSDVLEDADGTMLVVDTGSWYIHHCPTGQIRNSPATGGIYRVRRNGVKPPDDPRGLKINWDSSAPNELTKLLADPRPTVRERAQRALVARGAEAVPALARTMQAAKDVAVTQRAVWALCQIDDAAAGAVLRAALGEDRPDVVAAAARAVWTRGDRDAAPTLCELIQPGVQPHVRLAAAEALSFCGEQSALPAVWAALSAAEAPDTMLEHALVHAAHRLAYAPALTAALVHAHPRVQQAAMLLLDQPPRPTGALAADVVFNFLSTKDEALRRRAMERLERHPEWADQALERISDLLGKTDRRDGDDEVLVRLVTAFEANQAVRERVVRFLRFYDADNHLRLRFLRAFARPRLSEAPAEWVEILERYIEYPDAAVRAEAVRTAAALQTPALDDEMAFVATADDWPTAVRLEALRGVIARRPRLESGVFDLLMSQLGKSGTPAERLAAASLLGRAELTPEQTRVVVAAIRTDSMVSPTILLPALSRVKEEAAAEGVVTYLNESLARGWEPQGDQLEELLANLPSSVREKAEPLRSAARDLAARRRGRLAEFEPLLAGGNTERGRLVFFGNKAGCGACHRVGDQGANVGPDLTKVGAVRAGRDILESVVLPSASFAQGYDHYVVQTNSGEVYAGIIPQPGADVLEVRDSAGNVTRLHKTQVKRLKRQDVSLMPEGLPAAMSREEFGDLLAFLQSLR
jgi:putative heme-binding domain-containing protein